MLLTLCLFLILSGCSDSKTGQQETGAKGTGSGSVPVSIALSISKDMPVEVSAVGGAEPFAAVGVKSQVAGILEQVNFKEGAPVKKGDLLFRVDPRPYQLQRDQVAATLTKELAALENARKQAERYLPAAAEGYVSAEQSEQMQTSVAALEAAVQADKALLESAQLDLDNCSIYSPLSGFTGELLVDQGNLIKAADDLPLVTINQVTPIRVNFTLPEKLLSDVKKYLSAGPLAVIADLPGEGSESLAGTIDFLDNQVNTATGSIQLKAIFDNQNHQLWPGQFVTIRLQLTTVKDVIVVPTRAIQTSQNGDIVYVVTSNKTVELRPISTSFSADGQTVVTQGMKAGETVVTDGQLRLRDGISVTPVVAPATNADPKTAQ